MIILSVLLCMDTNLVPGSVQHTQQSEKYLLHCWTLLSTVSIFIMLKEVANLSALLEQLIPGTTLLFQLESAHLLALKLSISNPTNPGWKVLYHTPILSTQILLESPVKIYKKRDHLISKFSYKILSKLLKNKCSQATQNLTFLLSLLFNFKLWPIINNNKDGEGYKKYFLLYLYTK